VVPSPQRAAALQLACAARQLARGHTAWVTPDIRPWSVFLEWQAGRAREAGERLPRTLSAAEEWWLWSEATRAALEQGGLDGGALQLEALRRAARTLFDWHISPDLLARSGRGESEVLARALERFDATCRGLDASASHRLPRLLESSPPGRAVTFAGFASPTPARTALAEAWSTRGASVREHRSAGPPAAASILEAADAAEELERAAQWCRARLEAEPGRRLLVVVADLAQRRDEVVRLFTHALAPSSAASPGGEPESAALAIEGGRSLADFALVRHALASLKLLTRALDPSELSGWLRAAFWRDPRAGERARLDLALRRVTISSVSAGALTSALAHVTGELAPIAAAVQARLSAAAGALATESGPAALHLWCLRFADALEALGWPGERALTSPEQQTRTRLTEVLRECAALSGHLGALSGARAAALLEALVARTAFAPASGDPAVTLSAALTDPIVRYDGIWVTGLHADTWPPPVRTDPFIPLAAQLAAGIPAASAAGTLAQARALQACWRHSASELIVSWPRQDAERTCSAAPLLLELEGLRPITAMPAAAAVSARVRASRRIETVPDAAGAPWGGGARLPAGTRLIELQSRCAFRAHAELRLAAAALETARPGIDPRERGRLLHRSLELLWASLRSSAQLRARSDAQQLDGLIAECVSRAAERELEPAGHGGRAAAVTRERGRAERLIRELCALELTRTPFTVREWEARRSVALAGVQLEVRIDRIDELEDGSWAIIDYKSGKPVKLDWLAERISQPQLLVYEAAAAGAVSTLAAIHLVPGHISYRGFADHPERLPGIATVGTETPWPSQIASWRAAIAGLAGDFLAGVAVLNPQPQACRTCHLHVLCRIADVPGGAETDPDPEPDSRDD